MATNVGVWYKCKWCNGFVGILPNGNKFLPPGTVCHSKPISKLGIPNSVPCPEYNRRNAQQVADAYVNETPIDSPESFEPANN